MTKADAGPSVAQAKAICAACPVRSECLDIAIDNDERFGIWGGMTRPERLAEQRRRRRADRSTDTTRLRNVGRIVADRLDNEGAPDCADRIRRFSPPELITVAELENTP